MSKLLLHMALSVLCTIRIHTCIWAVCFYTMLTTLLSSVGKWNCQFLFFIYMPEVEFLFNVITVFREALPMIMKFFIVFF